MTVSQADVWELPSQKRLHAAIGKAQLPAQSDGRGHDATGERATDRGSRHAGFCVLTPSQGIIMAVHLFRRPHPHVSSQSQLRLLCAYENGSVAMWAFVDHTVPTSIEGRGWEMLWRVKLHVETSEYGFRIFCSRC